MMVINSNKTSLNDMWHKFIVNRPAVIGALLIISFVFFSFTTKGFLTRLNMSNMLQQLSMVLLVTTGEAFVVAVGGIDLAIGDVIGLATVLACFVVSGDYLGLSWWWAIIICIASSMIVYAIFGFLSSCVGLPAFIGGLGIGKMAFSAALLMTNGVNIFNLPDVIPNFSKTLFFGFLPAPTLVAIVFCFAAHILLSKTVYGRAVYATGTNQESARFSGIKTKATMYGCFLISGLATGIAAFLMVARIGGGMASAGSGYQTEAITGVIVGGGSLTGGRGSIGGAVLGALLMMSLKNGMQVAGITSYLQSMITGVILIFALYLDTVRIKHER